MNQRILIQLGKHGDVLSLLPLAWHYMQSGERIAIMSAKPYCELLDGVSYCDRITFDGSPWEIDKAYEAAQQISPNICCVQTAGPTELVRKYAYMPNCPSGQQFARTDCFQKEAWRLAGRLRAWTAQPPLVFDMRVPEREGQWLVKQSRMGRQKKILLLSTAGETSAFPYPELLRELIRLRFPKFTVIDLSDIKAKYFFDLLGLYEQAHVLVTTDSAPLHLAYAVPTLPVVALIQDKPSLWHGSAWRPNHIFHCRYGDFPKRAVEMLAAIENIGGIDSRFAEKRTAKVLHAWTHYDGFDDFAKQSWRIQFGGRTACPIELGSVGRDSITALKDKVRFPFVKDVLRMACFAACSDDEIICLTRCHTAFSTDRICSQLLTQAPCYSHRSVITKDGDQWHPAVDLFAFSRKWWLEHEGEYPQDMILGNDAHWHRVLMELMKKHGAKELPFAIRRTPPLSTGAGGAYITHNESLASKFYAQHKIGDMFSAASTQVKVAPINRHSLFRFGYNPTLVRFQSRLLMAYRYHPDNQPKSRLGIAELDDYFNVKRNTAIDHHGNSLEDPRFFVWKDSLYLSYVESNWPAKELKSVVKYGRLVEDKEWLLKDVVQPGIGQNDGTTMEKNWIFWECAGKLTCLYKSHPRKLVIDVETLETAETDPHLWPWGPIKGGTAPLKFKEGYIRFFHSTLDNEPAPFRRRYYIGAVVYDATNAYVSKKPIISGSMEDDLTVTERSQCAQYKPKVVFPAGAVEDSGAWLVSFGINDSSCAIALLTEKDLNL